MVSGLAPGSFALTWMVGKSTCGRGATGSMGKATMPTRRIPAINSDVAIGRRMKGAEIFTSAGLPLHMGSRLQSVLVARYHALAIAQALLHHIDRPALLSHLQSAHFHRP